MIRSVLLAARAVPVALSIFVALCASVALAAPADGTRMDSAQPALHTVDIASLPVPFRAGGLVDARIGPHRIAGRVDAEPSPVACRLTLALAGSSTTAAEAPHVVTISAGGKARFALAGETVEAFCCPELRFVTLRHVRRQPAA